MPSEVKIGIRAEFLATRFDEASPTLPHQAMKSEIGEPATFVFSRPVLFIRGSSLTSIVRGSNSTILSWEIAASFVSLSNKIELPKLSEYPFHLQKCSRVASNRNPLE